MPQAEQVRLLRPEHSAELMLTVRQALEDSHATFKIVEGRQSYGLNLDGSDGKTPRLNSCAHEDFVSPSGEPGIDNQWHRAIGCTKGHRQGSAAYEYATDGLRQGDSTILIELTGVDGAKNDNDVQVGFYSGQDPTITNVEGVPLTLPVCESITIAFIMPSPAVRSSMGVLTTEPVEVLFTSTGEVIYHTRDARSAGNSSPTVRSRESWVAIRTPTRVTAMSSLMEPRLKPAPRVRDMPRAV